MPTVGPGVLVVTAAAAWMLAEGEEHTLGEPVDAATIPMMLRRRLVGTALTAIRCGLGALPATGKPVEVVSCGRHGDLARTQRLLFGIMEGESPSPLDFSLSVHNALAGMLDLLRRERTGHTSIAAGRATLTAALLELWARLQCAPDRAALLLYAEPPVPEELQDRTDPALGGTVLALGIEHQGATSPGTPQLAVLRRAVASGEPDQDCEFGARLIAGALRDGGTVRLPARGGVDWLVTAPAGTAAR